jgi:TetR/AcrR family transcriptional repressor of nem operon
LSQLAFKGETVMPRASREDAAKHRAAIITAAARLFRERGVDGVSVPDVMEAVGLTHGGFYRHFASKDELVALATDEAFRRSARLSTKMLAEHENDTEATRRSYIENYLSPLHRANPGAGCPNVSLCGDIGHSARKSPVRQTYAKNLTEALAAFTDIMPDKDPTAARKSAIENFSAMVGAMLMARASQGDPISDEILETVKAKLLAERPKRRST